MRAASIKAMAVLAATTALACGEPATAPPTPTPVPPKPPVQVPPRTLAVMASSPVTSTGFVLGPIMAAPAVVVTDGSTVQAGVTVEFRVLTGGGQLGRSRSVTGQTGSASSEFWILGAEVGEQQVGVFIKDSLRLLFAATAAPQPSQAVPPIVYSGKGPDDRWHLFRLSDPGATPEPLTGGVHNDDAPILSPAGDRMAFIRNGRIHLANADGAGFFEIPNHPQVNAQSLSWSPDGTRLLFADALTSGLSVIGIDGTGFRVLTAPGPAPWDCDDCPCGECRAFLDQAPAWSPDGSSIAFTRVEDLEFTVVWIMNEDGSQARRLGRVLHMPATTAWWAAWSPVWSRDNRIAFVGPDFGDLWPSGPLGSPKSTLFSMASDGSDVRVMNRLSYPPLCSPTDWSASGEWILLDCRHGDSRQVHVLNSATGATTVLHDARSATFLEPVMGEERK